MSNDLVYVIGDSFFNPEPNNWLSQSLLSSKYTVINWAAGGQGFLRQFDYLTKLEYQTDFADIKYCIVGWSSPLRLYDPVEERDWTLSMITDTPARRFRNNISYKRKKQALLTLASEDFFDEKFRYKVAKSLLEWVNTAIYNNKKYSHIKFINFYCVYDSQHQVIFDNQVTVQPSLFDYFSKIHKDLDQFEKNHMSDSNHTKMKNFLSYIIEQLETKNTKLEYTLHEL